MKKISAVYQIKNKVTGERYVGSSKDVELRWRAHKKPSTWKVRPNSRLYKDIQKYGIENFLFAILAPVEPEYLKQVEQEFIDLLQPSYNNYNAKGKNVERWKATKKAYKHTVKAKASQKAYQQSEKYKAYHKAYEQSENYKATKKACDKARNSQLCNYNDETLTLNALSKRFRRAGIQHAMSEARKYLIYPKN